MKWNGGHNAETGYSKGDKRPWRNDYEKRCFRQALAPLKEKWRTANYPERKRQILEILGLNDRLDNVTLCVQMRKPFDVLAEGLDSEKSRGDRAPAELFWRGVHDQASDFSILQTADWA